MESVDSKNMSDAARREVVPENWTVFMYHLT